MSDLTRAEMATFQEGWLAFWQQVLKPAPFPFVVGFFSGVIAFGLLAQVLRVLLLAIWRAW